MMALLGLGLVAILTPGARADRGGAENAVQKKLCYCGCDAANGAAMCEHMCDLAKYKDRSWANNCEKRETGPGKKADSAPSSKKNNRNQWARAN